jgi:hypothetical protein
MLGSRGPALILPQALWAGAAPLGSCSQCPVIKGSVKSWMNLHSFNSFIECRFNESTFFKLWIVLGASRNPLPKQLNEGSFSWRLCDLCGNLRKFHLNPPYSCCVSLDKLLKSFVAWFPSLWNGDNPTYHGALGIKWDTEQKMLLLIVSVG